MAAQKRRLTRRTAPSPCGTYPPSCARLALGFGLDVRLRVRLAAYPPSLLRQADEVAAEVANGWYPANGQPTIDAFADETGQG